MDDSIEHVLPRLRAGEVLAEDLAAQGLDAARLYDRSLGAVRGVLDGALERAREADRRAPKARSGALHGVPIALKDNIDVAGSPTTSGCRALAQAIPRTDAAVVGRLRSAGAVLLAKTNLSEFSFEIRSRSSLGGDVRNPFAPEVTAGGSSGGAAVAVSAGFALAAVGTDTGGSIRTPAAYNGLVGFRPTHGGAPAHLERQAEADTVNGRRAIRNRSVRFPSRVGASRQAVRSSPGRWPTA